MLCQLRAPTPVAMNIPNTHILVFNTILPEKEARLLLKTGDVGQGQGMYRMSLEQPGVPKSEEVLHTDIHNGGDMPKKQTNQLECASDETL